MSQQLPPPNSAPPATMPDSAPTTAPPPPPTEASEPMPRPGVPGSAAKRAFLVVATVLFVGWMGWLSFTALTKSRAPVVSHAQAANAKIPVRAKLVAGTTEGKPALVVTVVEQLTPTGPAKDTQIGVGYLDRCSGYTGPGDYLLLLEKQAPIDNNPTYTLAELPRSPGADPSGAYPIYPWTDATGDDLRAQVKRLFP